MVEGMLSPGSPQRAFHLMPLFPCPFLSPSHTLDGSVGDYHWQTCGRRRVVVGRRHKQGPRAARAMAHTRSLTRRIPPPPPLEARPYGAWMLCGLASCATGTDTHTHTHKHTRRAAPQGGARQCGRPRPSAPQPLIGVLLRLQTSHNLIGP